MSVPQQNGDASMIPDGQESVLVRLMRLIDALPAWGLPPMPDRARRGRPPVYGDRLFWKAVVVVVLRRLRSVHALVAMLEAPEMAPVRALLSERGHLPSRRTWERRLGRLAEQGPAVIAGLGQVLIARLHLWEDDGRAVAVDSTPLEARGKVWHQAQRRAGVVHDTR